MKRKPLSKSKKIVFSLLSVFLFFSFLEATLRVFSYIKAQKEQGRALPSPLQRQKYTQLDSVLGYSLKPNYNQKGIKINALGFRGPEIKVKKNKDTVRIVVIGDSCTFGLAGKDSSFCRLLEKRLNLNGKFEVINAGVEGYTSLHALRLWETRIAKLKPDIALIYIGWNNMYSTTPFHAHLPRLHEYVKIPKANSWRDTLNHLFVVKLFRQIIYMRIPQYMAHSDTTNAPSIHPLMAANFQEHLKRLIKYSYDIKCTPVLMTLPSILSPKMSSKAISIVHYPYWTQGNYKLLYQVLTKYNNVICNVAKQHRSPLIDNKTYIDTLEEKKDTLFFDTIHFHKKGHMLLAENIYKHLVAKKLIKKN